MRTTRNTGIPSMPTPSDTSSTTPASTTERLLGPLGRSSATSNLLLAPLGRSSSNARRPLNASIAGRSSTSELLLTPLARSPLGALGPANPPPTGPLTGPVSTSALLLDPLAASPSNVPRRSSALTAGRSSTSELLLAPLERSSSDAFGPSNALTAGMPSTVALLLDPLARSSSEGLGPSSALPAGRSSTSELLLAPIHPKKRSRQAPMVPKKRAVPLKENEVQEAAYLLGRKADGRPIDEPNRIRRLVEANETMHETRIGLKHGRGNLAPDNETTNEAQVRVEVSYVLGIKYGHQVQAATALALAAGNCDQNGLINAIRQGAKLKDGETTHVVGVSHHTWAEQRAPGSPGITMDTWANGPAIESVDAYFESDGDKGFDYDATTGKHESQLLDQLVNVYSSPPLREELMLAVNASKAATHSPPAYSVSNQVVDPDFAERARTGLEAMRPLNQEILAVGVAREAYELNVKEAALSAPDIIEEASNLDDLTRPPVVPVAPESMS